MKQILQLHISFANMEILSSFCALQMISYTYFSLSFLTLNHICHGFFCSPFPTSTLQVTSYTKALPGPVLVGSWNFAAPHAMQKKTKTLALWKGTQTPCAEGFPSHMQNQTQSVTLAPALCQDIRALVCALQRSMQVGSPLRVYRGSCPRVTLKQELNLSLQGLNHTWVLTYLCYLICQNVTFIIFVPKWF